VCLKPLFYSSLYNPPATFPSVVPYTVPSSVLSKAILKIRHGELLALSEIFSAINDSWFCTDFISETSR